MVTVLEQQFGLDLDRCTWKTAGVNMTAYTIRLGLGFGLWLGLGLGLK